MKKKVLAAISLLLIGALCLPMTSIKSKADGNAYHEVTSGTIVEADWKYADALTNLGSVVKVGQGEDAGTKWIEYKFEDGYTYHNGKKYDIHLKIYPDDSTYNNLSSAATGVALAGDHPKKSDGTQDKPKKDTSTFVDDDDLRPYAGTKVNVIQFMGMDSASKEWLYDLWLEEKGDGGITSPVTSKTVPFVVGTVWNASVEREKIYSSSDVIYTSTQLCKMHAYKTKSDDSGSHVVEYSYGGTGFEGWYPHSKCNGDTVNVGNCGVDQYSSGPAEYILGLDYDNTTDVTKSVVKGGYAAPGNGSAKFEFRMGWQAYEVNFTDNVSNAKVPKVTQDKPLGVNPTYPALGGDPREIIYWTADHDFKYGGETISAGTKISDAQLKEILKQLDETKIVKKTGDPYERITFTAYVSNHTHSFIYEDNTSKPSVDSNKIQSYCNHDDANKDDCPFYGEEHKEVLVITTPDMQYNGTAYNKTSVSDDITSLTGATKEIKYYKSNTEGATSGGTEIGTTPPIDTGYYYAVITLKEGVTDKAVAVSPFKIYSASIGGIYTPPTVTLNFDTNGNGGYTKPGSQSGASGFTGKVPSDIKIGDIIDGYQFTGWFKDKDGKTPFDFKTGITDNTTVFAGWEKVEENTTPDPEKPVVKVEFETEIGVPPATQVETPGNTAEDPGAPMDLSTLKPGTVINGYRFDGWFLDKDYTIKYNFDTPLTEDIVLYAKWTALGASKSPKTGDSAIPWVGGFAIGLLGLGVLRLSTRRRRED